MAEPDKAPDQKPDPKPPDHGALAARLEKLEAENVRLQQQLTAGQSAKEAAEKAAAEKRGEWEKLYGEEKAKGTTLAQQLAEEQQRRQSYEEHLSARVKSALAEVPEGERPRWEQALKGLDPLRQDGILELLRAGVGVGGVKPGPAGPGKRGVDLKLLRGNSPAAEQYRVELVRARMAS